MSPRRLSALCFAAAALLPTAALACLWDYDTLQMERSRSPSALEVITGKFLRHTPEFYRWRINDRLKKIQSDPDNLALYDDLAVAYEKTGQRDLALATIRKKAAKKPGVYETESNLGTFLMLDGHLEEALKHIDAALAINPDAHFGREKYQKRLAEYMISRRVDGKTVLPLADDYAALQSISFPRFLAGKTAEGRSRELDEGERQAAIRGVLGMMRFANHDSPVLLEVLGDLLSNFGIGDTAKDEKQLAARAYLKASYAVQDPKAREAYRQKAQTAIHFQSRFRNGYGSLPLAEVEAPFREEISQADAWFAEVRANELTWIREGKNPEEEFARRYYDEPQVDAGVPDELPDSPQWVRLKIGIAAIFVLLGGAVVVKAVQFFRPKAANSAPPSIGITVR